MVNPQLAVVDSRVPDVVEAVKLNPSILTKVVGGEEVGA
jgi:hypothetical protein